VGYELTGLDRKVAVVTGAGRMRSIGHSIAIELAKAGCDVAVIGTGRHPSTFPDDEKAAGWCDVDSVADEVRALGRRALALRADISNEDDVIASRDDVVNELGRIDILVNNASVAVGKDRVPVVDLDLAVWQRLMDVNVTGSLLMSKHFGAVLVAQGDGGSIVNISSTAGKVLAPNHAAYGASKAALQAMTGSMAQEVGASGVRVNAVLPGLIDTSRMDGLGRGDKWNGYVEANIPLGRAGTPRDVAALVVFLCSDEGAWITGQQYLVDGGRAIGY
jgi:NAD(P)-dependent dehydrogenase (short-subunit alcohol dehydrogenase family)